MLEVSLHLLAEIGGWPVLKEARALVETGRVRAARRDGPILRARVQGADKIYDAELRLAATLSGVETHCTCSEARRGRVCAHVLAAGVAALSPAQSSPVMAKAVLPAVPKKSTPHYSGPKFFLAEDETAPPDAPRFAFTVLLPLQLSDSLRADSLRVILEAQRSTDSSPAPFDALLRHAPAGFSVAEEDGSLLRVLAATTGSLASINAVPRPQTSALLRALAGHSRVWLGKKQKLSIIAASERPRLTLRLSADGALELSTEVPSSLPSFSASVVEIPLPESTWLFDAATGMLSERRAAPATLQLDAQGRRRIAPREIPTFLTQGWTAIEAACEVITAPELSAFRLEIGTPRFEILLEGALSGLTLELTAHYENASFSLRAHEEGTSDYQPDPHQPLRFWRRDLARERTILNLMAQAGFSSARGGSGLFSLTQENRVAPFLANTLARWKQRDDFSIKYGERLELALREIDIAEPEFIFRPGGGNDWLGLDLKLTTKGKPIPLDAAEIQRWLQTGQSHARLPNRRVLLVPTEAWSEMREVIAETEAQQTPGGGLKISPQAAPYLSSALTAQGFRGAPFSPAPALTSDEMERVLTSALWSQLRPYQQEGVTWLATQARRKFSALLADDMGLGKTLQTLGFIAWLRRENVTLKNPVLVVCPTSLVVNWQREITRFVPHLRALDLTGAERAEKFSHRADYDVLITSYAILRRDLELYRTQPFSLVVLDEAQHIKNRSSQNALAAKALIAQHRLILTGTPLENSILDLWSLFDFLQPGYLGTAQEFKERYETPLGSDHPAKLLDRLRHRVKPFFLRRTKEEVLKDLPPRLEHLAVCELTDEQREVYRAVLEQGRRDVFAAGGKGRGGRDKIAVFTTLLRLRQVCCHLALLPSGETPRVWQEPSAKMERTFELIEEARDGGHRVLLFSQFVRVLHLLREEATRRKISFCYLDGQTTDRQGEVDRFQRQTDVPLFLISLKAGGTGLNLTGADTVIHFDPWWNPAVEEQATARAHRLGQQRTVQSYKLIAAGTVEEKIQAMQARKKEIFAASVGDEAFVENLSGDELEELLQD